MPDFTVVIGIDAKTAIQLEAVLPTWKKHKPSLFERPWIIFHDRQFRGSLPSLNAQFIPWPPLNTDVDYGPGDGTKWSNPQRHKMLAGFVHVAAAYVKTDYWLKLDADVIATGMDDWINPNWFYLDPAIICPPWGYTKPPDQMDQLNRWVENNKDRLSRSLTVQTPPLAGMTPEPGSKALRHKRICSWCGFFRTDFTRYCSSMATRTAGIGKLPVPSQDGYMWYVAKRTGEGIVRADMKARGWQVRNGLDRVREAVAAAMDIPENISEIRSGDK